VPVCQAGDAVRRCCELTYPLIYLAPRTPPLGFRQAREAWTYAEAS